jgi:hypothetical protein
LAAAFLVLLGVLGLLQYTHAPTTEDKIRVEARILPALYNVSPDHVAEVTLKRDKDEFVFTHQPESEQWQMTKPLEVLADASQVRNIVNDLKNLERRTLSSSKKDKGDRSYGLFEVKNASDLAQYKLDQPLKTVTLTYKTRDGKGPTETATLLVGDTAEGDEGLYVKLPDQNFVFVVRKSSLSNLDKKLTEFREHDLIATSRWAADRIALAWQDRKLAAEKKDTKWQLTEPLSDRGDRTKIEELIGKFADLKVEEDGDFIDDNAADLAKYGLDKPQLVVEVRKEKGTSTTTDDKQKGKDADKPQVVEKLLIGGKVEGKDDKVYAKIDGQKYVVAVKATVLEDANKQPNDLRNHDLVELTQADVDYVSITRGGAAITMSKKDFDWEIHEPKSVRAESTAVSDFLKKIDELEIKEFDVGDAKELGLDQPAVTLTLYQKGLEEKNEPADAKDKDKKDDKDNKDEKKDEKAAPQPKGTPIKVHFGNRDTEKKLVYVKRGDEPGVFAVADDGLWDVVDRDYLAYRRKQILSFSDPDVAKISLLRDGKSFSVERKEEKEGETKREVWRMTEPVDAAADGTSVSDILFDVTQLSAKKFIAEGAADLKPYGLDNPRIRATVTLKAQGDKKAEQHVLLVGSEAPDDGGSYAKLADGDLVFSVEQRLVGYLNAELHDRSLMKFDLSKVEGATLTWPDAKLELANQKAEGDAAKKWSVVGDEAFKLDAAKPQDLITYLSNVSAATFAQYDGDFQEAHGLGTPALLIEVKLEGESTAKVLRIGAAADGQRHAATGEKSGPVGLIAEDRLKDVLTGPKFFVVAEEKKEEPAKPEADKKDTEKKGEDAKDSEKKEPDKNEPEKKEPEKKEPAKEEAGKKEPALENKEPEKKDNKPAETSGQ